MIACGCFALVLTLTLGQVTSTVLERSRRARWKHGFYARGAVEARAGLDEH